MLAEAGVKGPQVAPADPPTVGATATPFACAPPPFTTV
jgi:hypothetical protein